ncbi:nucleotidyltransferase domain-containing protein [Paenibacillus tarimensis]
MAIRLQPLEAAKKFVATHFPNCNAALLAGSASRGQHKENSDLDIVIIDDALPSAYRESLTDFGWRIEAFIHTTESIKQCFENDRNKGRPTMPNMCASGIILRDDGTVLALKREAQMLLDEGPKLLTPDEIRASRYFLTDLLDDFIDADRFDEALMTMNVLSLQVAQFVLRVNGRWIGRGKGLAREFRQFNEKLSNRYIEAIRVFSRTEHKQPFIQFVDDMLEPHGGRLFEGFSLGKQK